MSPSFVTRLCSDWTVHPFSIWLTRLSRWRDPFIPTVQQSAPCCNLSLHPKHRCKDTGYFSRVHARTVFMRAQAQKMHSEHTQLQCAHIFISRQTPTALTLPSIVTFECTCRLFYYDNLKKKIADGKKTHATDAHRSCKLHKGFCCLPPALHSYICHRMRSAGAV